MNSNLNDDEAQESNSCRFKFNSKLNKRAPLFITDFTNGRIKMSDCKKIQFECFKSADNFEKIDADRKLLATNKHMNYSGGSSNQTNPVRYFVGVRNKKTGKTKLYDSRIFRMKPDISNISAALQMKKESEKAEVTATPRTYREGMDDLTENFGSKVKKRAMNARLKSKVDTSLEDIVNLDDINVDSLSESFNQTTVSIDYLPHVNRDASTVMKVFDVSEIISFEEDIALAHNVQALLEDSSEVPKFCSYVSDHLDQGYLNAEKMKYLIYYNYLASFQKLSYKELQRKDFAPDIPQPFKQKMTDNFIVLSKTESGRSTKTFPPRSKDKLLSHFIVLALFIDDYIVNTNAILKDLRSVTISKIVTIAQAIGCHIKPQKIGDGVVKFVELKLPLFITVPKYSKKQSSARA